MWGRLEGEPLRPRALAAPPWTGGREDWLAALHQDLSARWCAVRRGSPHASWDLELGVGPILSCRLHTAVLWRWDPVTRRTWALSRSGRILLAVVGLALALAPQGAAVAAVLLGVAAAVEAAVLTRLSNGAVARTTRGVREIR
jgi:hypothetical protein